MSNPQSIVRNIAKVQGLTQVERDELAKVTETFAFQAPEYYLSLIDWKDPNDPIRKIIVPSVSELNNTGDFDPCNEASNFVAPGVQHKYHDTALMLLSDKCEGLCRYCFRKRLFVDKDNDEVAIKPEPALDYIREHKEITSILLSGGDILTLSVAKLEFILNELRKMEHINTIRIGSRVPVFNPERILGSRRLITVLRRYTWESKRLFLVTHFDHPREVTTLSRRAIAMFVDNGIPVLNQHPLLHGVNDDPYVIYELYKKMAGMGVSPYYVFLVRPTFGNTEFQVPIVKARKILNAACYGLSGIEQRQRLVMSHATGKIEVLGISHHRIYMRYLRARKKEDHGRFMVFERDDNAMWLEDLKEVSDG